MTEDDFKRIEAMMAQQLGFASTDFRHQLGIASADFRHQLGIAMEDAQHKFELLAEGQQLLTERMERMADDLRRVEAKVDGVAIGLAAHRADTEAHRGLYGVRES